MNVKEFNIEYSKSLEVGIPSDKFLELLRETIKRQSRIYTFNCYIEDCREFTFRKIISKFNRYGSKSNSFTFFLELSKKYLGERMKQTLPFKERPFNIERALKYMDRSD